MRDALAIRLEGEPHGRLGPLERRLGRRVRREREAGRPTTVTHRVWSAVLFEGTRRAAIAENKGMMDW